MRVRPPSNLHFLDDTFGFKLAHKARDVTMYGNKSRYLLYDPCLRLLFDQLIMRADSGWI